MKRFTLFGWVAALVLAIPAAPNAVSAQQVEEADTLSISGTFGMDSMSGIVGDDLASVFAEDNVHGWTLTLHGVSYSHEALPNVFWEDFITRVHATSFEFQFFGPEADVLNAVVSGQLAGGSLPDGAVLEVYSSDYFDPDFPEHSGSYSTFSIGLGPLDSASGVAFDVVGDWPWAGYFYPTDEPLRVWANESTIIDRRPGNSGSLESELDPVDIGSSEPPVLPPTLSIADASVLEGNKGTSRLELTVRLSRSSSDAVTVDYRTSNGTAVANSDYTASSGTLTFQPGQTSRSISLAIQGDRKREPNETFSVQLSNAVGATINDGVATATIINDD